MFYIHKIFFWLSKEHVRHTTHIAHENAERHRFRGCKNFVTLTRNFEIVINGTRTAKNGSFVFIN